MSNCYSRGIDAIARRYRVRRDFLCFCFYEILCFSFFIYCCVCVLSLNLYYCCLSVFNLMMSIVEWCSRVSGRVRNSLFFWMSVSV